MLDNQYLSPSFKQAMQDGIVWQDELEMKLCTLYHSFTDIVDVIRTERFAVLLKPYGFMNENERSSGSGYSIVEIDTNGGLGLFNTLHIALNFMLALERDIPKQSGDEYLKDYLRKRHIHETALIKYKGE